jgi:hypothetical protein
VIVDDQGRLVKEWPDLGTGEETEAGFSLAWSARGEILVRPMTMGPWHAIDVETGRRRDLTDARASRSYMMSAAPSTSGERLAAGWNRDGGEGTWLFDAGGPRLLRKGLVEVVGWTPDDRFIYALSLASERELLRIDASSGESEPLWSAPVGMEVVAVSVIPGAAPRFILTVSENRGDAWLLEIDR